MNGTTADAGILQKMIGPGRELPPEVARFFLDLSFSDEDYKRMADLSEKANEGELTAKERHQLTMYVMLNDFLIIMHSQARSSIEKLQKPGA